MKIYVKKQGDSLTFSNLHIADAVVIEPTDAEKDQLFDGKHAADLDAQNKLTITPIVRPVSPDEQSRADIKAKLEAGTATDTDIKEALKLLL